MAVDFAGNVYEAGTTTSLDFPVDHTFQPRLAWTALRGSADGGKTWTSMPHAEPVNVVAGSAKAPGVLYAGTSRAAYKSTDSGKTWLRLPLNNPLALDNPPAPPVNAIAVDPANPSTVFAAAGWQILVSRDAGASWAVSLSQDYSYVYNLALNSLRPSTLYAVFVSSLGNVG